MTTSDDHEKNSGPAPSKTPRSEPTAPNPSPEVSPAGNWHEFTDGVRQQSQRQTNRQLTALGEATADLLQIRQRFVGAIHQAMDETPPTMADLEDYAPALGQLLSLEKQIHQSSQLQLNLQKLELTAAMQAANLATK